MICKNKHSAAVICVDWGSTNFRAFLLDAGGELLDRINSDAGMLKLRQDQFEPTLMQQIAPWLESGPLPVLMSGMVGSQRGWHEAAYVDCPASMDSLTEHLCWVPNEADLKIMIVPGMKGESISGQADVMRGEEVQIFGALALLQQTESALHDGLFEEQVLFCLPGTHSKWARVGKAQHKHAQVLDFSTQMTGELYSLLDKYSILGCMSHAGEAKKTVNAEVFEQGVSNVQSSGGLLHQLFSARSNVLAGTLSSTEVGSYLSGLLVGTEVKTMLEVLPATQSVYLVGNETLNVHYRHALEKAGVNVRSISGDQAAYMGMIAIAKQIGLIINEED